MPGQRQPQRSASYCRIFTNNCGTLSAASDGLAVSRNAKSHLPVDLHFVPPFDCVTTCSSAVTRPEQDCASDASMQLKHHLHNQNHHQCTDTVSESAQNLTSRCQNCLPVWSNCKWWSTLISFLLARFRASSASFHSLSERHHCHPQCGHHEQRHHETGHWSRTPHGRKPIYLYRLATLLLLLCISSLPVSSFTNDGESTSPHNANPVHRINRRHKLGQKQTEIGLNITRILNSFFDNGYDKRVRPNYAGSPVEVGVTMHIISISSISAVQMDFTSDFYFRQVWLDSRLSFKPRPGIEALYVGAEVSDKIWVPDTFFANEKSAQFHMATTPNTFIRIKASGEVFRSMRLTVTSSCPMNLQYFPLDSQKCTIEVESYGYSMADIQYKWGIDGNPGVVLAPKMELPQFKVNKHRQKTKVEVLSTGNYSRLVCEIEFVRSMGYYLIQIYIPASLIVIISWVSFWLHRNASPARVQLGVTTVLTMTTLMSSTNAAMPKISYIKSIDVFLGTCFVMVFAALLEYATVGYMGKRIAMRKTRTQQILKILNEHREKCIIAAAAASSNVDGKDGMMGGSENYSGSHRNHSGGGHSALIRTASLYPGLERTDPDDGHPQHKRQQDFRSSSTAGHACYQSHNYSHPHSSHSAHQGNSRPLERSSSLKSRVFSDCDDPDPSGMNNFNDDLSVFVPVTSSDCATAVGGTSSLYNVGGMRQSTSQSPHYRYQSRHSASDSCYRGGQPASSERPYLQGPSFVMKDYNTLFGVSPSDIDKYSRVVFPVCFLCFNLMYWIIYMHISEFLIDDQSVNSTQYSDD